MNTYRNGFAATPWPPQAPLVPSTSPPSATASPPSATQSPPRSPVEVLPRVEPPVGIAARDIPLWRAMLRTCVIRPFRTAALIAAIQNHAKTNYARISLVRDQAAAAGHIKNVGTHHEHQWVALVLPA